MKQDLCSEHPRNDSLFLLLQAVERYGISSSFSTQEEVLQAVLLEKRNNHHR